MTSDEQRAAANPPHGDELDGNQPSARRGKARSSRDGRGHDWIQVVVAIFLIGLYVVSLWVMFGYRNDRQWDRMVYLFSGYEAIVFVAVGAIFGTRIQRASVESATEHAREARDDLVRERHRSDDATEYVGAARTLAAGVKSYATRQGQEQEHEVATASGEQRAGARGKSTGQASPTGASPIGMDPGLAVLVGLADEVLAQRQWG